nr:MAG: hypothetical protein 2 [Leviviridae sp.]
MLMSFTEPLSITVSGSTIALPRTSVGNDRSEYTSGDGLRKLSASHDYGKRIRRALRLDATKISPDPFKPAENVKNSMSVYMVFDVPIAGYDAAAVLAEYTGFKTLFSASSDAMIVKLLGGES